ncbi:hypothetical protein DFH06DRAFT_1329827 [Mycena polygramma]|nr:hypothetical protein DFH06DRAFT_1329827 [Mycena polygramma]
MFYSGRAHAKAAARDRARSPQPNLSCFRTPTTPLSFSLAQRPHYNLRPASARSFTVTPPSKQNKKKAEAAPKPVIHPPFSAAQTKARWAPLVCSEVKAMIPLLQSGAVPRRSCGQLQGIFQGCERVMKKFRAETDIGPIEIEAFLLSIWIAVREAKEAYPEFAWKKSFPTLYNIVPPDLDRRAEIETFIPSLPDSHFELPRILASLRYASSGDEAPPPTKKARHRSPSVAETPPPQASSSRRQLTPPVVERPKPKPIGRGAAVVGRGHQAAHSISPDVEEIAPTGNIHAADQAADIDAYVRRTHDMGYLSDHFDEVAEIYPRSPLSLDHPRALPRLFPAPAAGPLTAGAAFVPPSRLASSSLPELCFSVTALNHALAPSRASSALRRPPADGARFRSRSRLASPTFAFPLPFQSPCRRCLIGCFPSSVARSSYYASLRPAGPAPPSRPLPPSTVDLIPS